MAEAVFRHKIQRVGLDGTVLVDSAGTDSYFLGQPPHRGTRQVLQKHNIPLDGLTARQLDRQDLQRFDYLVAMAGEHLSDVGDLARACGMRGRLVRLLDYADPQTVHGRRDVPDPYYTGQFDLVYDLIDHATDGLLAEIQRAIIKN